MRLLIVDDEPIIREGIKRLTDFEALGIEMILEAENGEEALDIFKEYLPDIVLADINMPKMNGLDFAGRIKGIKPECRIALITGYDYFDYAQAAIKIGVDDYILKPVSKTDIAELLKKLCHMVEDGQKEKAIAELTDVKDSSSIAKDVEGSSSDEGPQGYKSQIDAYIDIHIFEEGLNLSAMADALGLSSGYLSGMFKKLYGLSFKEFVQRKRLEKARLLILSTSMRNYEISQNIGISDPNYFSAAFKKYTGMSPNQYRNSKGR